MGEVASTLSLVGGRIAQRRGVPMVSPSSTNPKVTQVGDYVFRVCFLDPFQGFVMAKFARQNLKLSKVAILKDVRNDYSIGLADAFRKAFVQLGGTIVGEESYGAGDTEFSAQLTKLKRDGARGAVRARLLHRGGRHRAPGAQARPDGADDGRRRLGEPRAAQHRRQGHRRQLLLEPLRPRQPHARARSSSSTRYHAKLYKEPAPALAALGYDATMVIADAMRRAGSLEPQRHSRRAGRHQGLRRSHRQLTLDANRNPVKPAVVVRVTEDGRGVRGRDRARAVASHSRAEGALATSPHSASEAAPVPSKARQATRWPPSSSSSSTACRWAPSTR